VTSLLFSQSTLPLSKYKSITHSLIVHSGNQSVAVLPVTGSTAIPYTFILEPGIKLDKTAIEDERFEPSTSSPMFQPKELKQSE
jgi:hypothetical protein